MSSKRVATAALGGAPVSGSGAVIRFGSLEIDAAAYGSQGNAILGIKDSGKTYTATLLAERLFAAGVPFTVFDPIGVWRFLRVPGDGPGLPVVVAGGISGDLPLTPANAASIVEAAMQNGVSLVLDLFSMELSKADWRRIVRDSVKLLLHRNAPHGLRHVFIEEAHEFVPQLVRDGLAYAEVEKLAVMGGNARLGYTLISPRSEQINKAVLELCENLFLHRQRGRNSLVALGKWLKIGNVAAHEDIVATLSTLPTGECWAWLGGSDVPVRVKVPVKDSFHPNRRLMRGETELPARGSVDVAAFVAMMQTDLPSGQQPTRAHEPAKRGSREADTVAERARAEEWFERGLQEGLRAESVAEIDRLRGFQTVLAELFERLRDGAAMLAQSADSARSAALGASVGNLRLDAPKGDAAEHMQVADSIRVGHSTRVDSASSAAPRRLAVHAATKAPVSGTPDTLSGSASRLLRVLMQRAPVKLTWHQVATLAGLKARGGYFGAGVRVLRDLGAIEEGVGLVWAAPHLVADGGNAAPAGMAPAELLTMWCEKLPAPAPAMLRALAERGPMTRDELGELLGLQTRGGFWGKGIGALRNNRLVELRGGSIELSAELR